jgi:hypothetical protein
MRLLRAGQRGAPPLNCGVRRHVMRHRATRRLVVLTICVAVSACAEEVRLPDHPVTVRAPAGFEGVPPLIPVQEASLRFKLPLDREGGRPTFPEMSLAASAAMTIEDPGQTLSDYARKETEFAEQPFVYGPVITRIDGQQAIEFASSDQATVHFVSGGGARMTLLLHEIAIAYQSRLYSCRLEVTPEDYERYVEAFRTFCRSVRFGGAR